MTTKNQTNIKRKKNLLAICLFYKWTKEIFGHVALIIAQKELGTKVGKLLKHKIRINTQL